jgi:hypothetical protein
MFRNGLCSERSAGCFRYVCPRHAPPSRAISGGGFIVFIDSQNRPHTHPGTPGFSMPGLEPSIERQRSARARTFRTLLGYQLPPRAVATPRSLRALAICCNVVAPAFFTCFMIGSTVPAKRSASALPASPPLPRIAARLGLPSFTPRALAAARLAVPAANDSRPQARSPCR